MVGSFHVGRTLFVQEQYLILVGVLETFAMAYVIAKIDSWNLHVFNNKQIIYL